MLRLVTLLINYGLFFVHALDMNGWYPCTLTDEPAQASLNNINFECATVEVPLCHAGICNSSKTIDLFIKRKLAANTQSQVRQSVWFLAGGPGASSAALEMSMLVISAFTNNSVDVYTMDHRGTGRSSSLECVAAQATAGGSPSGTEISFSELPYCVEDVLHQIDGRTEAFSVTSAAHDLIHLMNGLADDEESSGLGEVYLYGTSYGTYLVERVMHLAPPQVKGYILDGVVSEAGPDPETRLFFSHWDRNMLGPSRRFFEVCAEQQEACPLKLNVGEDEDVLDAVLGIYDEIDETMNDCANELMFLVEAGTPSLILRPFLGLLVRDSSSRALVPSILGRFHRCNSKDREELELVIGSLLNQMIQNAKGVSLSQNSGTAEDTTIRKASMEALLSSRLEATATGSIDQLEYLLISYSELWSKPSPTEEEIGEFYMDGIFSLGTATLSQYCLVSGNLNPALSPSERDPACNPVLSDMESSGAPNFTQSFTYATDEFYNKTASVPPNASLLLINGGLDFQTPLEFGRHQFESTSLRDPETSRKMLVEFDFGGHVCGLSATTTDDETMCAPGIVASFISNRGDPNAIDTSCMNELPELQLTDAAFSVLVQSLIEAKREQVLGVAGGIGG